MWCEALPLQEYEKALKYVRGLLQTEPQNTQAKELERLIDKAMKKGDTYTQSFIKPTLLKGPWSPSPQTLLWGAGPICSLLPLSFSDGLVGMAIVGGMALGVAGLAGLIGLAVSKSKS